VILIMETKLIATLVGMHFRPPAKAVLEHLPSLAPLDLDPEPNNPYDPFAVRVLVMPGEVPAAEYDALGLDLGGYGYDLEEFLQGPALQLGYIGSKPGKAGPLPSVTYAPTLQPQLLAATDYKAELHFDVSGDPLVHVTLITGDGDGSGSGDTNDTSDTNS
jgi:hypothetical protein